jgi:mannose-6-phosphate isomerase-like protein (cupin superfamily)
MTSFALADLLRRQAEGARPYLEFLHEASMSIGLYVLAAGGADGQSPHAEDEAYVVMAGRGRFTAAEESRDVAAGDVLFVAAGVPHHFHDITTELHLIVLFAPPESGTS